MNIENVQPYIEKMIYKILDSSERDTLELKCELANNGKKKLSNSCIYMDNEKDGIIHLFGEFSCRFQYGGELEIISLIREGSFSIDFDNRQKALIDSSFECTLKEKWGDRYPKITLKFSDM